jgi:hypothetical protein
MSVDEHKTFILGLVVSTAMLLSFCQISTPLFTLKLDGFLQFSFVITLFSLCFAIIDKRSIIPLKFSIEHYLVLGLLIASAFSVANADFPSTSAKRLMAIISSTLIVFSTAYYALRPQKFLLGFSIGIITVTAISVLYSLIALVSDFNFVNTQPYELIEFKLFGFELQQTIAHRAFMLDGSTYYIQRYAGIFPNPNGLGLMVGISFILSHLLLTKKKVKYLVQAVCVLGLFLSLSRMGVVLSAAALIYLYAKNTSIRRTICAAMIAGLFSFLFVTVSPSHLTQGITDQIDVSTQQELFQLRERADLMARAWIGFLENWPVGVGYGVGAEYLFPDRAETLAIHSVFLNTALETGILGITFLLAIWLSPIFATKTSRNPNNELDHSRHVIATVLFGLFFAEAFDLSVMRFHYIHLIFFFLLGIWSALGRDLQDTAINDVQHSDTPQTLSQQMEPSERRD